MTDFIMKVWLALTDVSSTPLGTKLEDSIFTIIAIIVLLIVFGKIVDIISIFFGW